MPPGYAYKFLLVMKLILVLSLVTVLQSFAVTTYGQKITIDEKDASIIQVFRKIRQQSGFDFLYNKELLDGVKVSVKLQNASLDEVLKMTLNGLGLSYKIDDKVIYLQKDMKPVARQDSLITGRVVDAVQKWRSPG